MSHLNTAACNRRKLAALAVAGSVLLAGCSSSTASSQHAAPSGATGTSTASGSAAGTNEVAAAKADIAKFTGAVASYPSHPPVAGVSKLAGKTIWYVPLGAAAPNLAGFGVGVQQALAAIHVKTHTCDGKFVPTAVASCLSEAVSQGAAGVITGFVDYALVPNAFQNLVAHHIPVLVAGEPVPSGTSNSATLAFYDTSGTSNLLQRLNDEAIIADSAGKAKILYVAVADSQQTKNIATYTKAFFAQHCPGCTLTQINYNTAGIAKLSSQVSAALIAHPDTTYVDAEVDSGAALALAGVQSAGFTNKITFVSMDGDLDSLQRIKAGGPQFADAGVSPVYEGWLFADSMVRMLVGTVPAVSLGLGRLFTKDNVGGLILTPGAYQSNAWYGGDGFQKSFLTAWGS